MPPSSPNPFLATSLKVQPDSPFTAARKRIRGEGENDELMDSMLMRPDKKRRSTMNRSVSTSTTAAPGLFASSSDAYNSGNPFGPVKTLDSSAEVLEESPVKQSTLNGTVYKPIFDDDDIALGSSNTEAGRGTTSRAISLPTAPFFGRKVDSQTMPQTRHAVDSKPGPSKPLHLDDEDVQMKEDESSRGAALLAPTPVKGDKNTRWKGKYTAKSKKGKDNKTTSEPDEEEEDDDEDGSHEPELSVTEVGWRIMGPLHTGAFARGSEEEMGDDDDENFQLPPLGSRWAQSRRLRDEEPLELEEPGRVEIDLSEDMRDVLQLSPPKPKVNDQTLVQDILSGKGDRTKRAEVWLPGDAGDESDEWESEGAGWWEAEL